MDRRIAVTDFIWIQNNAIIPGEKTIFIVKGKDSAKIIHRTDNGLFNPGNEVTWRAP
jgi:hypothetical protein